MIQAEEVSMGAFERLEARLAAGGPVILDDARRWVEAGAAIVGGRCGVGVEHIRVLAEGLKGS